MSIKGKIAFLAGSKIAEKVVSKVPADDALNSVINKLAKAKGLKTSAEHIQEIKKNYLIIKSKSYSLAELIRDQTSNTNDYLGHYQIVDSNGTLKYKSDEEKSLIDREILDLFDASGMKIGYVKKHLISTGFPLFEHKVKKCTVFLGTEKIASLKKYVSFGELEFEEQEGKVKITHNNGKNFRIYYKGKLVATLHDCPINFKEGFTDKFVMEYDDLADEVVAILLTTAIDLINT